MLLDLANLLVELCRAERLSTLWTERLIMERTVRRNALSTAKLCLYYSVDDKLLGIHNMDT